MPIIFCLCYLPGPSRHFEHVTPYHRSPRCWTHSSVRAPGRQKTSSVGVISGLCSSLPQKYFTFGLWQCRFPSVFCLSETSSDSFLLSLVFRPSMLSLLPFSSVPCHLLASLFPSCLLSPSLFQSPSLPFPPTLLHLTPYLLRKNCYFLFLFLKFKNYWKNLFINKYVNKYPMVGGVCLSVFASKRGWSQTFSCRNETL